MSIRFIVTVMDFNVQGRYAMTVRVRKFRNLAIARHYEAKFYKKARRKPNTIGKIENWGSNVKNFVNGGNYAIVRQAESADFVRTITITCGVL